MLDYVYNNDQVKYFTQIKEYEYKRANPLEPTPIITPQAILSFPLPVNMPSDAYQSIVREFDGGEAMTGIDLLTRGLATSSVGERGTAGSQTPTTSEKLTAAALGAVGAYGVIKGTTGIGDLLGLTAGLQPILDLGGAYFGKARNPHTAMIFDRMGVRHFTLQYNVSPRDEAQSRTLDSMLFYMRSKMHPRFMPTNKFVLEYPSMFSVKFIGLENMGVPTIDYSFLKGLSINATPQGQVYYKGGFPTILDITMEFVELDMKTREYFQGNSTTTAGGPR